MSFFRAKSGKVAREPSEAKPAGGIIRALSRKRVEKTESADGGGGAPPAAGGPGLLRQLTRGKSDRGQGKVVTPNRVEKTNPEWKQCLSRSEYNVLRKHYMEKPFNGKYVTYKVPEGREAIFFCKGCDSPVFSGRKIDPINAGWITFSDAIPGTVDKTLNDVGGASRLELVCKGCDGFLGIMDSTMTVNSEAIQLREIGKEEYELLLG